MLFVCFHPQLSIEAQLALALRTVCGLSPAEIGAAFLTSEAAIAEFDRVSGAEEIPEALVEKMLV